MPLSKLVQGGPERQDDGLVTRWTGGGIPERSKGPDCKSGGTAFAGSNPASPTASGIMVVVIGVIIDWAKRKAWYMRA